MTEALVAVLIAFAIGLVFAAIAHFGGRALCRFCESDPDD